MTAIEKLAEYSAMIEQAMAGYLPITEIPQGKISEAMAYSVNAGGKRLRPGLTLEFCRICGGDPKDALAFACAVEMVHTYSLIHDDLPCMDDDDFRRGKPTNHKVYGEAMATLAGDALLTLAFETLTKAHLDSDTIVNAVIELSRAAGVGGMLGGQVLDLEGESRPYGEQEIKLTHNLKTGALFAAACKLGCLAAGASRRQMNAAEAFAKSMGYAFQLRDDVLDVIGDAQQLGKATGHDEKKQTIITVKGMEYCEQLIFEHSEKAKTALEEGDFNDVSFLRELTDWLTSRKI